MSRVSRFLLLLSALVLPDLVSVRAEDAVDKKEKPELQYIRVTRNERRLATAMQTSIIRFGKSDQFPGHVVDLIGAVPGGAGIERRSGLYGCDDLWLPRGR